jgi:N-acetyl-anhydromuramyl-L-alanine amidase AmpD
MENLHPENVEYLIVHHTATSRDRTTVDGVRRFHVEGRGWEDIGYHYFIAADGTLHAGRAENLRGAHCRADGMNARSLGICIAGHFDIEAPTIEQLMTSTAVLRALMRKYAVPAERVLGHGEVEGAETSCPGNAIRTWLQVFRAEASA